MQERAEAKANQKSSFVRQNPKLDVSDAEYDRLKAQVEADMAAMDKKFGKFED